MMTMYVQESTSLKREGHLLNSVQIPPEFHDEAPDSWLSFESRGSNFVPY